MRGVNLYIYLAFLYALSYILFLVFAIIILAFAISSYYTSVIYYNLVALLIIHIVSFTHDMYREYKIFENTHGSTGVKSRIKLDICKIFNLLGQICLLVQFGLLTNVNLLKIKKIEYIYLGFKPLIRV